MHFPKMQLPKPRYQIFTTRKVINSFIISFIFASIVITIEIHGNLYMPNWLGFVLSSILMKLIWRALHGAKYLANASQLPLPPVDPEKRGVREALPGAWEDEGKVPLLEKGHSQHPQAREQKVKLDLPFQVLLKSKPAAPAPPRRSSKSNSTLKSPTPSQIQVELQTQFKSLKRKAALLKKTKSSVSRMK